MSLTERGLLTRGASGDNEALKEIWTAWSPRILLYLKGSVPEEEREDLCQEIMLKVFRSLESYNPLWAPSTWIYSIASRCRIDWYRKQSRTLAAGEAATGTDGMNESAGPELLPGPYLLPEESLIRKECEEQIAGFLESREERDRRILFLHVYEGLSGRAVARAMNLPAETVRYRLKILKKELKEVLDA